MREAAVFGVDRATGLPVLCAAVVPSAPMDPQAFHRRCRDKLGPWAPTAIMHVEELPRNEMGKVQRTELAAAVLAHKGWTGSAG